MSHVLNVIETRRAHRALSDQPIRREVITRLISAAHLAPSCANNQPWRFVVVQDPVVLQSVKALLTKGNYWAAPSPAIVTVSSHESLDCQIPDGRQYHLFGCGMATMNLMLQAEDLGLIAHPIAGFKQAPIKELLGIPTAFTLIALVILGYPSDDLRALSEKHRLEEVSPRSRRDLSTVMSWDHWWTNPEGASVGNP
jgi:glutaredoxin-dependent peroxiredoxin